jgi:hypothetical protein
VSIGQLREELEEAEARVERAKEELMTEKYNMQDVQQKLIKECIDLYGVETCVYFNIIRFSSSALTNFCNDTKKEKIYTERKNLTND